MSLKVGWREWLSLPGLGIPAIKAKIDSGARTSALHTFNLEAYRMGGKQRVRFGVHPLQHHTDVVIRCDALVVDRRVVSDSGGHKEMRFVICTSVELGGGAWELELTLANREAMLFRMLLGRSAIAQRAVIEPGSSYLQGKPDPLPYSISTHTITTKPKKNRRNS